MNKKELKKELRRKKRAWMKEKIKYAMNEAIEHIRRREYIKLVECLRNCYQEIDESIEQKANYAYGIDENIILTKEDYKRELLRREEENDE